MSPRSKTPTKSGEIQQRKDYRDLPISAEAQAFDRPDQEQLLTMAAGIARAGMLEAISLHRNPETGTVEVLDGFSRIEAAKLAKLASVPCRTLPDDTDRLDYVRQRNNLRRDQTVVQKVIAGFHAFLARPPDGWLEALSDPRGRGRVTEAEEARTKTLAARYDAKTLTPINILRWWCGGVTRQAVENALNVIRLDEPGLIPWDAEEDAAPATTAPAAPHDNPPKAQKAWKLPADPEVLLRAIKGSTYTAKQLRHIGEQVLKLAKDGDP